MLFSTPFGGAANGLALILSFFLAAVVARFSARILPSDRGRELAFDGDKSRGKLTSAGVLFVPVFAFVSLVLYKLSTEVRLYILAILVEMTAGFLDDNAGKPWSELKKGLLDLAVAVFVGVIYLAHNSGGVHLALWHTQISIPPILMFPLIVLLMWAGINITNITDGVDGLSATLGMLVLMGFLAVGTKLQTLGDMQPVILSFAGVLLVYLWHNAPPSRHLMGDAGSRALGLLIALAALKSGAPFLFIPLALVFIMDGGSSLMKLSGRRYLKLKNFMHSVLTPLHDHVRRVFKWSDAQTVLRFALVQVLITLATLILI
ncbi:MAG: phospho-N-acetylmuramoyl-pentapeptide-transferase [Eubacteriales bacterium]|jgi:phospho-N-acetylmuramoyl-pentapeptide-transferase|nr:phospho-N-acetylmuramoyl-pentapeptide-transferase [Eubacteriales bacterium]MDD4104551.1 phospho-N-acetylmuramoyl-pentapeptide-transferase [Eubacteriales bacterium]MDD4710134.1 phospho-N-acetylmuramoyl-pentapeptide-transferase [Eubacteriales bacterium]NLO14627.1 phospho-N-acetylmuramoyl-pentapeptide-transferase [Clostridiales bacterium]